MKSLAELAALRERTKPQLALRHDSTADTRVLVAVDDCGLTAGARAVLLAFVEQLSASPIEKVSVVATGCMGLCALEPTVEIHAPGQEKVTYVNVTPDRVERIIREHLAGGRVVEEFTIGAARQ